MAYAKATAFGGGGLGDPMLSRGDIIYRDPSNDTERLALGADRTVLTSDGTDLAYALPNPLWSEINKTTSDLADITTKSHTSLTDIGTNTHAQVDTHLADGTKHYLDSSTTRGDINYRDASNVRNRLPVGAADTFLFSDGTDPAWASFETKLEATHTIGNLSSTGLVSGGDLTIDADPTKFDVSAGKGQVVDNYTDPDNPAYVDVTWTAFNAQSLPDIATQVQTFILINSSGALVLQAALPTASELRDLIHIGTAIHTNLSSIGSVSNTAINVAIDANLAGVDISRAIGPINVSGNVYSANGANLNFDKSAGVGHLTGINYHNDRQNPNLLTIASGTAVAPIYSYQDGASGFTLAAQTAIIPGSYDDGDGTLGSLSTNSWQIQRIYVSGTLTAIEYGQNTYISKAGAIAAISSEIHNSNPALEGTLLRSFLVVRGGATDLSDLGDGQFIEASKFGGQGSNGGTSSTTNLQQAYDNSPTAEITLTTSNGAFTIHDANTPTAAPLFEVQDFGGSTDYFCVDASGVKISGILDEFSAAPMDIAGTTATALNLSRTGQTTTVKGDLTIDGTTTGLAKGDVGLGNVDNTSDATKNTATATLTNKTMTRIANSFTRTVTTYSSVQTLSATVDDVVKVSGNTTLNLPAAASSSGVEFTVKKTDSNATTVTLDGNASELIDGATTFTFTEQYASYTIVCDGSSWLIL
tara:strand:- start:1646 stop:3742 length:2097 start_codon:yes stop_codon:yes gene_type:complete